MRGFFFLGRAAPAAQPKPAHNPPAAASGLVAGVAALAGAHRRLRQASAAGRAGRVLWGVT